MSGIDSIDAALEHHRAGRLAEAAAIYEQILQSAPRHAHALYLLGAIAHQDGDDDRALDLLSKALVVDPAQPDFHNLLGLVQMSRGELGQAVAGFRSAIALGGSAHAHSNLGTALKQQGRLEEAIECYRHALERDPDYAGAHYNLGNARRAMGDLAGAAACFRRALALQPEHADALASLGAVLSLLGQPEEAVDALRRAATLLPHDAGWHCELGDALRGLGRSEEAAASYRHALSLDGELPAAWRGLGCAEAARREYAAAIPCLERALSAAPDDPEAHYQLGEALFQLGQVDAGLRHFRQAAALEPREATLSAIAVVIPGSPSASNQTILDERRTWAGSLPAEGQARTAPVAARDRESVRVGYVSAFFQSPNWMKPVWGLLNHHDRERFEVHLFSDAAESRIEHGRRPHPCDRFHDTTGLSNQEVAGLIREAGIDILVDLNGYSAPARLPLFALRPAPLAVAWFNMYATTGMDCFDYLVGDEHVIPEDEETFYTEWIVRIPGCYLTFEVAYPVPEVAPPPCLTRGSITFGCLASQHKINADVLGAWAEILSRCPDSRLFVKNTRLGSEANREFVRARLEECGVPRDRVLFDGPADHFRFLEAYAEVDVALDTFPYNGGTTTTEALWQGVPVLTFPGDRWASRQSASLLRNAGLDEFVARDRGDYIDQAVALAGSPDTPAKLAELRRTMRSQLRQAPVCDTEAFARSMEQEYLWMWREKA